MSTTDHADRYAGDPSARRFRRGVVVIAVVALAVRLAYVLWYSRGTPVGYDANEYLRLAYSLSHHGRYAIGGDATALFPPGYPVFLAALQVLRMNHFTELLVGMAALGTGTTVVIAFLGRRVGGATVGLTAGAIAALYPNLFLAEGALMTEALTAFLVALALLLALRAVEAPTVRRFVVLGLPLGYGALTRSDGILFALLIVATVAWCVTARSRPREWARFARLVLAGLAASIVLLGGWLVRNEVQVHAFVPVAVNSWDVLGGANCHSTYYGARLGSWDATCLQLEPAYHAGRRGEIALNRYVRDKGIDYLREHAGQLPTVVAARLGLTFGAYDPWHELQVEGTFEGRDVGWSHVGYVMYLVLLGFAIGGFVLLGKGSTRAVLLVPLVAVFVSTVAGYGNQRFRMPLEPVLVTLGALALVRAGRRFGPSRATTGDRGA